MPVAATLNVAVCPAVMDLLDGCVEIAGATAALVTDSVAGLLVALPMELLTVTVNCEPLSEVVAGGVVYEEEVAPLTAEPFFFH